MSFRVEACPGRAAIAAAGENFTDMIFGKIKIHNQEHCDPSRVASLT
jgi:hypothetical protein